MFGIRLIVAQRKAEKTFKKYEGVSPRNKNQPKWYLSPTLKNKNELERVLGIFRKTKVPCSCLMCGNPRRYWSCLPIQEIKQHLSADSQCKEIGWSCRKLKW